ncbi:NADP-dependent oxidoreductase [Fulvivirgaceae bacterium PWU5]|uniref:NADP-dependent oxidoreductase n=1 Tax=Dawidia cretensis TaxID=2782350 RepID=A0AAP2GVK6_9BACT|nr:NADP-dependent oxidoreductase [Dawidia cretensis]MBT1711013.1 NADP-dependent oxidoreductase [Dawidia cretensis]
MKAIILRDIGGVENLQLVELPLPQPGVDEILINVKAIGVNPADTFLRKDRQHHHIFGNDTPIILGWDVSGVVTKTGPGVEKFNVGDEVFGMIRHPGHGKAYAEYAVAPVSHMALKPANVSHEKAAAASLAALTALQPIQKVKIKPGQRVLVTGAGGGVGHFAVQLANYFGAYVIGVASGSKRQFVLDQGAHEFIDYQMDRFEQVISPVDLVIEAVKSDEHVLQSLEAVKPGGSLISLWSSITDQISGKAKVLGVNAFYNMVVSSGDDMAFIAKLLNDGSLRPHISAIYPLAHVAAAHLQLEKNNTQGKLVLVP